MSDANITAQINAKRKQLADVELAIADAQQGQSVSMAGASITRQGLDDLRTERSRLQRELRDLEIAAAGGRVTLGATVRFPPPGSV